VVDGALVLPEPERGVAFGALGSSKEFVIGTFHSQFAKSFDGSRVALGAKIAIPE